MRIIASRSRGVTERMLGVCVLIAFLIITGCTTNSPLAITLTPSSAQTVGQGKTVSITAAGDSQGVTWTLTGAGALSGSTTTATTYTAPLLINSASTVTVTATSVKDTTKTKTLTINLAPISITFAPSAPPSVDQGKSVLITAILQNDTNSQGVTWTFQGAASGSLTNVTPTSVTYNAPSSVSIATSDTVKATAVGNATINSPLTVNLVLHPAITTTTIADGSIAIPYGPAPLTVTGGVAPFVWAIGNPVLGFTVNPNTGAVSGTPAQTGPLSLPVQVTDAFGLSSLAFVAVNVGVAANNPCGPPLGNESVLKGEYAFYAQGFEDTGSTPIALAASFNADGAGHVTAGEEDFTNLTASTHVASLTAASSYVVGPDNRGCVSLVDAAGPGGTKMFRFALGGLSGPPAVASKGRIIEFDDTDGTGRRASGVIRLQTTPVAASQLQARYAFGMDGWDTSVGHYAVAGSFSLNNTTGAITSLYSDSNDAGATSLAGGLSGDTGVSTLASLSATTGRATATINSGGLAYDLAIYVINANEFFVVTNTVGPLQPLLSGMMIATGSAFDNASVSGNLMIHLTGKSSGSSPAPNATLGILTFTTGAIAGNIYGYDGTTVTTQSLAGATYTVDAASGRVAPAGIPVGPNTPSAFSPNPPVFYLTNGTNGVSAFIISSGGTADFGLAEVQGLPSATYSNASIAGNYLFALEDIMDDSSDSYISGVASFTAGSSTGGTLDLSNSGGGGLTLNSPLPATTYNVNSDGSGTLSGPTSVIVTNGTKLFVLDETFPGSAVILVVEK